MPTASLSALSTGPFVGRRRFLSSTAGAFATATLGALGEEIVAQKPRRVGLIGAGWYGKSDTFRLMQVAPVEVVGVADPDRLMRDTAIDLFAARARTDRKAKGYGDYRVMLKEQAPEIVLVGTPDHWHALTAIAAMEAGADVYLQKPISVDVLEGEAILSTARRLRRVVQIGTQRRSTPHLIEAKRRVIEAGLLGKIGHVEMCCYYHMRANGNPPVEPVPEQLDYEMWTGPAPFRPYDGTPHRRWWRTFMEYGNGIVGDMCVHMYDTARWMLGLGWPTRVSSQGGILVQKDGKSNTSDTQTAVFEHPEFNCVWQHRTWGTTPDPEYPWGLFIYGEKGTLKVSTNKAEFFPRDKGAVPLKFDCVFEKEQFPEDVTEKDCELNAAPATRRQMLDFLAAVQTRGRPVADVEQGHMSTASCILANLSLDLGRPLVYDAASRTIPGDAVATARLARAYRSGWTHPLPS